MRWSFSVGLFLWVSTAAINHGAQAMHLQLRGTRETLSDFRREVAPTKLNSLLLSNSADVRYHTKIVLGDQTFKVLIDTGSSDLWVSGNVSKSVDTGVNARIRYAANSVEGSIKQARIYFGEHTIVDQAFLEVPANLSIKETQGILGLGPGASSFISPKLTKENGAPVLDRIFAQNRSIPKYLTILLGRQQDPTDFFSGNITVGEVLEDYADVLKEPKLSITEVSVNNVEEQHLQTLLDPDGIIGPDGKAIPIESVVVQTENKKQATVVFDCGFTLPQVPRSVSDAIYSKFYGSAYVQLPGLGEAWTLPCEQEVNVTFTFGGKVYPMHPLDMSIEPSRVNLSDFQTVSGEKGCIGTFQPFTYDRGINPSYDMVLGMAFMRNVYSLFNYGDFVEGSETLERPYIQLYSITENAEAHTDFVTARLGGIDTTGIKGLNNSTANSTNERLSSYYIIAIVVIAAILLVTGAALYIRRCRRRR